MNNLKYFLVVFVMFTLLPSKSCSKTMVVDVKPTLSKKEKFTPSDSTSNDIPEESTFFNGNVSMDNPITISTPITGSKIQNAIDVLNNRPEGGVLKIPKGTHTLNQSISLKSNVHIEINKEAVIKVAQSFRGAIFTIGTNNYPSAVKNVKIYSSDINKRYQINYSEIDSPNKAIYFVSIGYANGFEINGAEILDNETMFSAFRIGPNGTRRNTTSFNRISENGIIKNCHIQNADYGYGLIQLAGGKNLLLKDISGHGGVTLRLEGSAKGLVEAGFKIGIQENIYAQNVSCTNGNAVLMLSPHAKEHGKVVVRDITAINCGIGIRIDKGFGPKNGYYSPKPYIGGKIKIQASDVDFVAQIKKKHYKYYPKDFREKHPYQSLAPLKRTKGDARYGKAITPIFHGARLTNNNLGRNDEGYYDFVYDPSMEEIIGFPSCIPKITNRGNANKVCN
ncbi:pectate lyase family protein [Aquimarina algicola]|uniref:Right-handed parallel beta-helix repeat-containing protein n=1 Tax=Aquimarina algicola TaxID=2589995 RepID=A0A504J7B5_9FLAO|nr:hypothetical protein [Aquimarina algicola]TPN84495.1 hypothetical protein FHK87_16310 [Aquimarina algicola]